MNIKEPEDAGLNEPFYGRLDRKVYIEVGGMPCHSSYLGPFDTGEEALAALAAQKQKADPR